MSPFTHFGLKKTTRDNSIDVDVSDFRSIVCEYFKVDIDDDATLTTHLKPIIVNGENFLAFCEEINFPPVIAIELMVAGRFDVLYEPRVLPKLRAIVKDYGIEPSNEIF